VRFHLYFSHATYKLINPIVCGFVENTTETLCARWAMLGAFSPFYRNHNDIASIPQEFYRWPVVARAAKAAISVRYRLLDYLYTALHKAHVDGTPVVQPLFFAYPQDAHTFDIDHQFLFGESIIVSPILEEGSEVEIYLPDDLFYEFMSKKAVYGPGEKLWVRQVAMDEIPLLIRGGAIIPMRVESAMTTKELREKDFEIVIAPGLYGTAKGSLYMDDGVSLEQDSMLETSYTFDGTNLVVQNVGTFNVGTLQYTKISVLSVDEPPKDIRLGSAEGGHLPVKHVHWDPESEVLTLDVAIPVSQSFSMSLVWEKVQDETDSNTRKGDRHAHDEL
jgi:alpha-glucosidase